MEFWQASITIIFIVFGSLSAPFTIWQLGKILKDRRQDMLQRERMKAEHKLEEMRIKAEMDRRIFGSESSIAENMTAELQALREEVRGLREELDQVKSFENNVMY